VLIALRAWSVVRRIPDVDIIHAPEPLSTGLVAPLSRTPVVLTTPGNIYERIANGNPYDWSATQAFKLAARSSARYCALIDAISHDLVWWWEQTGAPPHRIVMIPHGVDTATFRPIADARERLGLDARAPLIVYVGRLSGEKNVDVLMRAMTEVVRQQPDSRAFIVGSGPARVQLTQLTQALGLSAHVNFVGQRPQSELPLWYSAASAVVLPSSSEGLPRVMLEAMACGAPFIGTPISGVVDHVRDGETGFLVSTRDPAQLAACLKRVIADPAQALAVGHRGRVHAHTQLAWSTVMERFRVACLQVAAQRRPAQRLAV
jgi:glycosyltransferase involved in cell wall biosynthesis